MGTIKSMKEVENALPKTKDVNYVRALDAQGNPILISKADLAEVVGGLTAKMIPVEVGKKTLIADGCGLLLIQVPYVNGNISAYIIAPSRITTIQDYGGTLAKITVEKTKVYYTESREGSNAIYIQTALVKNLYYVD